MNSVFLAQLQPTLDKIGGYVFTNSNLTTEADVTSIAKTFEAVWKMAMDGNLYTLVCSVGLLIAIFAVGFWCVKFYVSLEEGGYRPAVNEMIFPLILVLLLSNGGANMRGATLATRDLMNNINDSVNKVVSLDVDVRTAINMLATSDAVKSTLVTMFESCNAKYNINEFGGCVQNRKIAADILLKNASKNIKSSGNAVFQAKLSMWQASWQQTADTFSSLTTPQAVQQSIGLKIPKIDTPTGTAATAATSTAGPLDSSGTTSTGTPASTNMSTDQLPNVLNHSTYSNNAAIGMINSTIMSFRTAFLYVIEVMMLVTALVGPIFVALSMFPVGTKPLLAWGTSFLSLGFCKICFSLISGLSAIAFVYAGPDTDMTVVAVVLGLLAPVLSFGIASGAGIGGLNNVAYIGQNFGLNTGVGMYKPETGQGVPTTTPTTTNIQQ
jgi:hypothetical protein